MTRFNFGLREFLEMEMEQKEKGRVMWAEYSPEGEITGTDDVAYLLREEPEQKDVTDTQWIWRRRPVHIFTPSELSALKEEVAREAFDAARQFVPHIVQDECFGPMEMMRHKYPTAKEWWAQREKGEGHE